MKKIMMIVLGSIFLWKVSLAATNQPYNLGLVSLSISSMSATGVAALVPPNGLGSLVVCTNCGAFNAGVAGLCMSTGTLVGSYVAISSATAVTVCK